MNYYDKISKSYDELYSEEQENKLNIVKSKIKILKNDKILDIGCGTGISSQFENFIVGIDPSIGLLKINKNKRKLLGIAEKLPFKNHSFDFVISLTSIQNFDNVKEALKEIKRVGKSNFVVSVLKKSKKSYEIRKSIKKQFKIKEIVEEEKDIIFFLN